MMVLKLWKKNIPIGVIEMIIQLNSVMTNSFANEHLIITNRLLWKIGHVTTQINLVITNPDYNEQKWPDQSCSLYRVWLYVTMFCKTIPLRFDVTRDKLLNMFYTLYIITWYVNVNYSYSKSRSMWSHIKWHI